jgi:hypothetical protein
MKNIFKIKTGIIFIISYFVAINLCLGYGEKSGGQYNSRSEYWNCSFGKPTLAVSVEESEYNKIKKTVEEVSTNLNLESQSVIDELEAKKCIVEPVTSGWVEVKVEGAQKTQNDRGIRQLINLVGRLLNGIGNAPILPFAIASDGNLDTISAYALGEEKIGSLLRSINHQITSLPI